MHISVGIVEDEAFARTALAAALTAHGVTVLFDTADASDALTLFATHRPTVALLDIHLGAGPSGVDLARRLRLTSPEVGLVFLTSFDEPRLLGSSLPPFPVPYVHLPKSSMTSMQALLQAITRSAQQVADDADRGRRAGSTRRRDRRARRGVEVGGAVDSPLAALTDAQVETLRLVAAGLSNAEIARRRVMREKSVEVTISRIAKALGVEADQSTNQRVHLARVYLRMLGAKHDDV